jgi:hypothetical protein
MPFHPDLGRGSYADKLVQPEISHCLHPIRLFRTHPSGFDLSFKECYFATHRTHDLCLWAEVVGLLYIDTQRDADTASEQSSQKCSKTSEIANEIKGRAEVFRAEDLGVLRVQ